MHPSMTQQTISLYGDSPNTFSSTSLAFSRHVEGLTALLLSLKKKPIIRYEKMSGMARKLSSEILYSMESQKELWDFRKTQSVPLLLILDRRNDPVTPLLSQWTYQAMVHELIGIDNGRVSLSEAPDVRDEMRVSFFSFSFFSPLPFSFFDASFYLRVKYSLYCYFFTQLQEIVLSPDQDPFFAKNLYDNFGDLGAHLSAYVSDYSNKSASSNASKIETVADMKRFVSLFTYYLEHLINNFFYFFWNDRFIEEYPEFRKLGGNVSKHVALVGELSRLVNARHLLEVSELEQSLASNESHASDLRVSFDFPFLLASGSRFVLVLCCAVDGLDNMLLTCD